ncbi:MAG: hypothetical protein WCD81_08575 [Candidatus Bathyarchaeia archaeon]
MVLEQQKYDPTKRFVIPEDCILFKDVFDTVLEDKWAFMVIWGPQRTGKSTCALWIPYFFWRMKEPDLSENEIWERVYDAIVFNLEQLIYKIQDKTMQRVWDWKARHRRIPIIVWDDFGVSSNKAVTQHLEAWDHFKGSFDALGTEFGVIVATMASPEEPTLQLENKITAEIMVENRGTYKYDKVVWQQDFKGWSPRHSKNWMQTHSFAEIPIERFKPYDDLRLSLAAEAIERIQNSMTQQTPNILKRLNADDIVTLQELVDRGEMTEWKRRDWFKGERKNIEVKLKAHQLVTIVPRGTVHHLDITAYGLDVLNEWKRKQETT